jgi:hypothetical protein
MSKTYLRMLIVEAARQELVKQEYDFGIINHIIGVRSMFVPVTPRLGVFLDPRKTQAATGTLYTPMIRQPPRLIVRGKFVVVAFEQKLPASLTDWDILKFKHLYKARLAVVEKETVEVQCVS